MSRNNSAFLAATHSVDQIKLALKIVSLAGYPIQVLSTLLIFSFLWRVNLNVLITFSLIGVEALTFSWVFINIVTVPCPSVRTVFIFSHRDTCLLSYLD